MGDRDIGLLFDAIGDGDLPRVRDLLAARPDLVNRRGRFGFTPLLEAVSACERSPEIVAVLIGAGADVRAHTRDGYTALHCMIDVNGPTGSGDTPPAIARMLVDAGADVEARQHWGWTPLMRALVEGTPDELRAMVAVGANVNDVFPGKTLPEYARGRSVLMVAVGDPEKVRALLDAGANPAARDAHGQTALEYAEHCLADAARHPFDPGKLVAGVVDKVMVRARKHMARAGVDPDAVIDEDGTTVLGSMESAMHGFPDMLASYDYEGGVRRSIDLIRAALAKR